MSLNQAKQFIQSIETDSALQSRVIASHWNTGVILREAAARKYSFTSDEFQTALDEVFGVLSEEVLVNAAGGKNDGEPGNDAHENAPPGHSDDRSVWAPPPGDVSGNSCLFGWRGR